jgi:hypothetical protein
LLVCIAHSTFLSHVKNVISNKRMQTAEANPSPPNPPATTIRRRRRETTSSVCTARRQDVAPSLPVALRASSPGHAPRPQWVQARAMISGEARPKAGAVPPSPSKHAREELDCLDGSTSPRWSPLLLHVVVWAKGEKGRELLHRTRSPVAAPLIHHRTPSSPTPRQLVGPRPRQLARGRATHPPPHSELADAAPKDELLDPEPPHPSPPVATGPPYRISVPLQLPPPPPLGPSPPPSSACGQPSPSPRLRWMPSRRE